MGSEKIQRDDEGKGSGRGHKNQINEKKIFGVLKAVPYRARDSLKNFWNHCLKL